MTSTSTSARPPPAADAVAVADQPPRLRWSDPKVRSAGLFALGILAGLITWTLIAMIAGPAVVSSPAETLAAMVDLQTRDMLLPSITASSGRILKGWGLGIVVGAPIGVALGRSSLLRSLTDPYLQFLRFIPPIAFIPLTIIWLGIGEASKVVLIFYTAVFIVTINMMAGVRSVEESRLRAAASLGASPTRRLLVVVLPSTVPYLFTASRLAMGNAFLTIVSADLVAAQTGVGALIWRSRNYGRIDWVFAGIVLLGMMGLVADSTLRLVGRYGLRRFGITD